MGEVAASIFAVAWLRYVLYPMIRSGLTMGEKELQPFNRFYADFVPQRLDDLKDNAKPFVNGRQLWEVWWMIDEADFSDGRYAGQRACVAIDDEGNRIRDLGWVPDGDLLARTPAAVPSEQGRR